MMKVLLMLVSPIATGTYLELVILVVGIGIQLLLVMHVRTAIVLRSSLLAKTGVRGIETQLRDISITTTIRWELITYKSHQLVCFLWSIGGG